MIGVKLLALPFVVLTAFAIAASPVPIVLGDPPDELATVRGEVTAFLSDDWMEQDDEPKHVSAFVIDNETVVEFGPWWYWMHIGVSMTEFIEVGDEVEVIGEWEDCEDDAKILCAWHIENLSTDQELTIKEEGRPPWAGGPKALGIDPWPSSKQGE